jgi:hypothetical protein
MMLVFILALLCGALCKTEHISSLQLRGFAGSQQRQTLGLSLAHYVSSCKLRGGESVEDE